jgi:hypothetical protein
VAEEKWPQRGGGRERVGSQAGAGRGRAQLRVARQLTVVLAEPRRAACATNGTVDQKALRAAARCELECLVGIQLVTIIAHYPPNNSLLLSP